MANALRWVPQLQRGRSSCVPPSRRYRSPRSTPPTSAAVAAATLTEPGHDGAAYRLTGPEPLRPAEQVAVLAEVLDRDLRFEGQTDEDARAEMTGAMPEEYVDAFFRYYADGTYDDSRVHPTVVGVARTGTADVPAVGGRARRGVPLTDTTSEEQRPLRAGVRGVGVELRHAVAATGGAVPAAVSVRAVRTMLATAASDVSAHRSASVK